MQILTLLARAISATGLRYGQDLGPLRFWMRDIDGKMARIVDLPNSDIVRYSLDGGDEAFDCSRSDWERLPIWTGMNRSSEH